MHQKCFNGDIQAHLLRTHEKYYFKQRIEFCYLPGRRYFCTFEMQYCYRLWNLDLNLHNWNLFMEIRNQDRRPPIILGGANACRHFWCFR